MIENGEKPKIIFVYNADSGVFNLVTDIAHKIFSPQTYACNLCALTHSNFGMKKEWKSFLETLENPLEFFHADEFKALYPSENVALPAIFKKQEDGLNLIAGAAEINNCGDLEDIKKLLVTDQRK